MNLFRTEKMVEALRKINPKILKVLSTYIKILLLL